MNQELLGGLRQVPGVIGAAVFAETGECLHESLPPPYDVGLVASVLDQVYTAFDIFTASEQTLGECSLVLSGTDGQLVVRQVEGDVLFCITDPSTNMAMLNVAMNVVAARLKRPEQASVGRFGASDQSLRAVGTSPTPPGGMPAVSMPTPPGGMPAVPMSIPPGGLGGAILTPPGGMPAVPMSIPPASWPDLPRPADCVNRNALRDLLELMRHYFGPAAKLILKQELTQRGQSADTIPRNTWTDFIASLATRIPTIDRRDAFLTQASAIEH